MRSENAGPVKRGRPSPASTGRPIAQADADLASELITSGVTTQPAETVIAVLEAHRNGASINAAAKASGINYRTAQRIVPTGAGGPQRQCNRRPALGSAPPARPELQARAGPTPAERGRAGVQIACPGRTGSRCHAVGRGGFLLDDLTRAHPGLRAVTNCSVRWVCCSTSTRPAEVNRSTNACRSNICSPITRAPVVIACRAGVGCLA
jgi:hypothetical protein